MNARARARSHRPSPSGTCWRTVTTRLHLRRAQQIERVGLAPLAQSGLELECNVEMLHQRRLAASGDHAELFNSGGARLLDGILDQRLVHDRQHFLGGCLGSGRNRVPRPATGDRLTTI